MFLTNWLAQAEHGGFYQAVAEGTYRKHGLDVEVRMGGPQVNVVQLLLAGQADLVMGYDLQTIKLLEQDLPVVTVGRDVPEGSRGHHRPSRRQDDGRPQDAAFC